MGCAYVAERRASDIAHGVAAALRQLPVSVIRRIENSAHVLDLRCLEDEAAFAANFAVLDLGGEHASG
jgi:L-seryl-tRNA(Ser) seleniumtransferase